MVIKNDKYVLKMPGLENKDVSLDINRRLSFIPLREQINPIILAVNNR
jgi:hypothetical protein